jgi:hypothetical protein
LGLSGLLQAALDLGQLRAPRRCLLSDTAQALASIGSLAASLFELATDISQFLRPCQDGLLPILNLLAQSS